MQKGGPAAPSRGPSAHSYSFAGRRSRKRRRAGFGRVPPLRSGPGFARRRQRYDCCQRRRAPGAPGDRCGPPAPARARRCLGPSGANPSRESTRIIAFPYAARGLSSSGSILDDAVKPGIMARPSGQREPGLGRRARPEWRVEGKNARRGAVHGVRIIFRPFTRGCLAYSADQPVRSAHLRPDGEVMTFDPAQFPPHPPDIPLEVFR